VAGKEKQIGHAKNGGILITVDQKLKL
jgi:hypothetical protein